MGTPGDEFQDLNANHHQPCIPRKRGNSLRKTGLHPADSSVLRQTPSLIGVFAPCSHWPRILVAKGSHTFRISIQPWASLGSRYPRSRARRTIVGTAQSRRTESSPLAKRDDLRQYFRSHIGPLDATPETVNVALSGTFQLGFRRRSIIHIERKIHYPRPAALSILSCANGLESGRSGHRQLQRSISAMPDAAQLVIHLASIGSRRNTLISSSRSR